MPVVVYCNAIVAHSVISRYYGYAATYCAVIYLPFIGDIAEMLIYKSGTPSALGGPLLASDIDKETCIKYLDRFLMFYVRTAEPLSRTATWLNKMDGGMSYLKNVIINDSLGIAEELEEQMKYHVSTYECEWKAAIENPEMRKKFSHFVNAPEEKDPTVKFEEMRTQIKAEAW